MTAYQELLDTLYEGESVVGLVFGDFGWRGFQEPEPNPVPLDKRGIVLSLEEAEPFMHGWSFYSDYGAPLCYAVTIWTDRRILWITQYDGSTDLSWTYRNPTNHMPDMPGG